MWSVILDISAIFWNILEKTCSSIDELMQGELCVIFDGDLNIFNDTVTDNRLVELKTIRGQLFIGGTSHVVMSFPNLEEISTTGG